VAARRLEQGGPLDQLAGVTGGHQSGRTGVGAALHVAAAREGDDIAASHAEVSRRLGGRGRGDGGLLLRDLVGALHGLVLVQGEDRPRPGGVHRPLRGGELVAELPDLALDGLGRPLRRVDLGVARPGRRTGGRRGQADRDRGHECDAEQPQRRPGSARRRCTGRRRPATDPRGTAPRPAAHGERPLPTRRPRRPAGHRWSRDRPFRRGR
jgi:hypothetical protein